MTLRPHQIYGLVALSLLLAGGAFGLGYQVGGVHADIELPDSGVGVGAARESLADLLMAAEAGQVEPVADATPGGDVVAEPPAEGDADAPVEGDPEGDAAAEDAATDPEQTPEGDADSSTDGATTTDDTEPAADVGAPAVGSVPSIDLSGEDPPAERRSDPPTRARAPEVPTSGFTVQLAAYESQSEADEMVDSLRAQGYEAYIMTAEVAGRSWNRVRVGSYSTERAAGAAAAELRAATPYRPFVARAGE